MKLNLFGFARRRQKKETNVNKNASSKHSVDLVIIIDTSPSMKDEAQGLSDAAQAAIAAAKSSCPSDLRVTWLGIEGIWKGTNFDRTIREYLTKECKVSDSKLRGRKRGELKSAGAQEDATRAIEDISDYFDWRKGATKAIFYLGDEALESGGSKTQKKDIDAANLAIGKAIASEIVVHTYFGISKSKHQESLKREYRRVAFETGGQYFSNQDAISGFTNVLEKVICSSSQNANPKLRSGAVYIQDCVTDELSKLYILDLSTGKTNLIGEIATEVSDIAFVGTELYGLDLEKDKSKLVKIDLNTGNAETIGNIGFAASSLAYNPQQDTLYATTAKQLIAIDINTGVGKPVLSVASKDYNCGEIAFDANGKTYITLINYDKKKVLASCNLETGEVRNIGDTSFPNIASIEFIGNTLYGVTGNFFNLGKNGQLVSIDINTGKGKLLTTTQPKGCWSGISIYKPLVEVVKENSEESTKSSSDEKTDNKKEKQMTILTVDTKENCYVINPEQMNYLQQNIASSLTLNKGSYEIRITSGTYSYSGTKTEGEPSIILWMYGEDGSKFVSTNTGYETGATWTTLNGYEDILKLEVENKVILFGLFFDTNNTDNNGSVQVTIAKKNSHSEPEYLTVDSKNNCYLLDVEYLSGLKQWNSNFVELNTGNYLIKITEGNASYWSDNKKFDLEPWILLNIKAGKFVSKLTGIETDESWCSLNGFKDEIILEVKEKTTLSGLFFDTYKEDNEGQIILGIEEISESELNKRKQQKQQTSISKNSTTSTSKQTFTTSEASKENTSAFSGNMSTSDSKADFKFSFNEAQIEQMWQQMAAKIETSVTVTDKQDDKKEAYYWDQLENWILKGYQNQAKGLAMQVARLEFMMKALTQQMEVNFNQNFQAWSGYFDQRLNELMSTRINNLVEEQVNIRIDDQTQNIKNLVVQQMQNDIDERVNSVVNLKATSLNQEIKNQVVQQMQQELEQRIDSVVNLKISNQAPEINNLVIQQIESDIDKRIESAVNLKVTNQTQEINNSVVQQIRNDMDSRIDAVVNLKVDDQTQNIKNLVTQQMQADMEKRIDAIVNLQITNLGQDIRDRITQQTRTDIDGRIDSVVSLKVNDQTQNIKSLVIQQMQSDIDNRINSVVNQKTDNNVQVVVNNVIGDIDNRINSNFENRILNLRNDVTSIVQNEVSENMQSIKTNVLSDIKKQQFYLDMQSIKAEVENFYSRLGQFETQLNLRINQGDTQLYNWTLEQLVALQGCMTDRQALVEMFESFSAGLKSKLDDAPCVQPNRFTPMNATIVQPQLSPTQTQQLPESNK